MELEKTNLTSTDTSTLDSDEASKVRSCCEATIALHAKNNAMMVCGTCKHIIKCFSEERPFKNYLKFCTSRHRKIMVGSVNNYYVVVFRAYEGFKT